MNEIVELWVSMIIRSPEAMNLERFEKWHQENILLLIGSVSMNAN